MFPDPTTEIRGIEIVGDSIVASRGDAIILLRHWAR
jgi:hypothetical protein